MAIAPLEHGHHGPQHQREAVVSGADQAGLAPEGYQQLDEQGELPAWQEFQGASDGQAEADDASSWTSSEAEGADMQQMSGLCCTSSSCSTMLYCRSVPCKWLLPPFSLHAIALQLARLADFSASHKATVLQGRHGLCPLPRWTLPRTT